MDPKTLPGMVGLICQRMPADTPCLSAALGIGWLEVGNFTPLTPGGMDDQPQAWKDAYAVWEPLANAVNEADEAFDTLVAEFRKLPGPMDADKRAARLCSQIEAVRQPLQAAWHALLALAPTLHYDQAQLYDAARLALEDEEPALQEAIDTARAALAVAENRYNYNRAIARNHKDEELRQCRAVEANSDYSEEERAWAAERLEALVEKPPAPTPLLPMRGELPILNAPTWIPSNHPW